MKARLRKGSVPCQAVCASGRAGPRRALSSSSSPWISFQSPNTQRVPHRTCGQWAEQERLSAGDGQTEAASALWLMGLIFGDHRCGWVARDAQWPKERAQCDTGCCSGDLMPQDGSSTTSAPMGWMGDRAGGFVLFILLKTGNPGS